MTAQALPKHVEKFLTDHISSVEQLEILVLLRRTAPRRWNVVQVNTELRGSELAVRGHLQVLAKHRFLKREATEVVGGESEISYTYAPESPAVDELLGLVLNEYQMRKTRVIEFIYTPRRSSLSDFAEAFRIKKGDR